MNDPDLFGHTVPQGDLFAGEPAQPARTIDFPTEARRVLAGVRAASVNSWSDRELHEWELLFPQMAGWLSHDEADQLRFDFAREVERLKRAA